MLAEFLEEGEEEFWLLGELDGELESEVFVGGKVDGDLEFLEEGSVEGGERSRISRA